MKDLSMMSVAELNAYGNSGDNPESKWDHVCRLLEVQQELTLRLEVSEHHRKIAEAKEQAREYLMDRMASIADGACECSGDEYDQIADLGWCGDPVVAAMRDRESEGA